MCFHDWRGIRWQKTSVGAGAGSLGSPVTRRYSWIIGGFKPETNAIGQVRYGKYCKHSVSWRATAHATMSLRSFDQAPIALTPRKPAARPPAFAGIRAPQTRSSRRRRKFKVFLLLELAALMMTAIAGATGTLRIFAEEDLTRLFAVAFFIGAAAAVIIPIIFYGQPERGYRVRRD